MAAIRDPSTDFADDGGTPGWRARHAPPVIDVYPNRRAEFRAYMRKHPFAWFQLSLILVIGLYLFFGVEIVAFLVYALAYRLITGHI